MLKGLESLSRAIVTRGAPASIPGIITAFTTEATAPRLPDVIQPFGVNINLLDVGFGTVASLATLFIINKIANSRQGKEEARRIQALSAPNTTPFPHWYNPIDTNHRGNLHDDPGDWPRV